MVLALILTDINNNSEDNGPFLSALYAAYAYNLVELLLTLKLMPSSHDAGLWTRADGDYVIITSSLRHHQHQ